jgi:hypothetical protein
MFHTQAIKGSLEIAKQSTVLLFTAKKARPGLCIILVSVLKKVFAKTSDPAHIVCHARQFSSDFERRQFKSAQASEPAIDVVSKLMRQCRSKIRLVRYKYDITVTA